VKAGEAVAILLPPGIDKINVSVTDVNGKRIKEYTGVTGFITAPLQAGLFLLQIQLPDGKTETHRLIVE
jgi:hypothetical protein